MKASPPISLCLSSVSGKLYRKKPYRVDSHHSPSLLASCHYLNDIDKNTMNEGAGGVDAGIARFLV